MTGTLSISLTVNGEPVTAMVPARMHLADFVRDELGLTGTHIGCEHGVCGACTIRLDGEIVRGCLVLAVQTDGAVVETVEGVSDSGEVGDLQKAFEARNALQCGYCTPGMVVAAAALLAEEPEPTRERIAKALDRNVCRCGTYPRVVAAIRLAADRMKGGAR